MPSTPVKSCEAVPYPWDAATAAARYVVEGGILFDKLDIDLYALR
jgi:hypothetical protein